LTLGTILAITSFTLAISIFYHNPSYSQISNSDSAYPDFCIAPSPPDLNCPEIPDNDFTVLPPDPHVFDRDADGVGCES
jgi:hypothetical protein